MPDGMSQWPVKRYTAEGFNDLDAAIAREFPLTVILNGQELVTLLCSPLDMKYLAAGYLESEGLLEKKEDVTQITLDEDRGIVRVNTRQPLAPAENVAYKRIIASGCGRGASLYNASDISIPRVESGMSVRAGEISEVVAQFQHYSELYTATHGVHSAALCSPKEILVFFEDVGRHNALDKMFGKCLLEGISLENRLVVTSGRISSDSVYKAAKRGMPVLVSVSSPTDLAVKIAGDLGITLVGRVTRNKVDVYTHAGRVEPW